MATHRRYRIGEHPNYDHLLEYLRGKSHILNPAKAGISQIVAKTNTADGLRELLTEWRGAPNQKGYFRQRKEDIPSRKLSCLQEIERIDQEHEEAKERARLQGKPEPEMNRDAVERRLETQAVLDVCCEEIDKLEALLIDAEAREEVDERSPCLPRGPRGSSWGTPVKEIDGQSVDFDPAGELRIFDDRSPYHLMRVVDYRELLVKPKKQAKRRACAEAKRKGEPIPRSGRGPGKIKWEKLPPRPKAAGTIQEAKQYLKSLEKAGAGK